MLRTNYIIILSNYKNSIKFKIFGYIIQCFDTIRLDIDTSPSISIFKQHPTNIKEWYEFDIKRRCPIKSLSTQVFKNHHPSNKNKLCKFDIKLRVPKCSDPIRSPPTLVFKNHPSNIEKFCGFDIKRRVLKGSNPI